MVNRSNAHFILPQLICLDEQIEDADVLSHAGHDRDLGRFTL